MGDQFLNIFSPSVSGVFGCNTNVQIGDVAHVYYNTLYGSKSNQDNNTRGFVRVYNTISRRIQRQREVLENNTESDPGVIKRLSRVLCGIKAHISSYVISATLAYHIVTK